MKSCFLALVMIVLPALAQEGKQHFTINVGTPEGHMLQAIGTEPDDSKRMALLQDFLAKYPKHEGASWVSGQLQSYYLKQKDYDKVIDAGQKGLADDPSDLDLAYNNLKAAEGKEDPEMVKMWSARTSENAHKILATGKAPSDDDQKQFVAYAKEVDAYSEYSISAAAIKAKDPKLVVELMDSLELRNPKSQYLAQASAIYLADLGRVGQGGKACGAADRLAAANPKDADALIYAGQCALQGNHFDRAVACATKALEAINSKSDADLGNRKGALVAYANWVGGVGYGGLGKYGLADKALRVALPSVKADAARAPMALFYLGLSNYSLGKAIGDKKQIREGLQFFEQCAAFKGPIPEQAAHNARMIKGELGIP